MPRWPLSGCICGYRRVRHNIPEAVIRRRFAAGLANFENTYKPLANAWFLYDNQHSQPLPLAQGVNP